jgi:hypothetical protein
MLKFTKHTLNLVTIPVCLFFINYPNASGQKQISGIVLDEKRRPVEFANIYIKDKPIGTLTNESGYFLLKLGDGIEESRDSLIISHISYHNLIYPVRVAYAQKEYLLTENKEYELATIELQGSAAKKEVSLGATQKNSNHFIRNNSFKPHQMAALIKNPTSKSGYLKKIQIYISGLGNTDDPIRIKLYDFDSLCNCPGQLLLTSDLIIKKVRRGWNKIDLSEYYVNLPPNSFFIVYEWLFNDLASANHTGFRASHALGIVHNDDQSMTLEKFGDGKWNKNQLLHGKNLKLLIRAKAAVYER